MGNLTDESATLLSTDSGPSRKRITVDAQKCTGCRCCEMACALRNYGECNFSRARIFVVRSQCDGLMSNVPVLCQRCEDALCVAMCPSHALSRDEATNAVVVDVGRCLGCRTCVEVCPFGGPSVDPRTGVAELCTLCEGDPLCVRVCTQGALMYVEADEESIIRRRLGQEKYLEYLRSASSERGTSSS